MKSAEKLIIIVCFLFQGVLCREFSISLPESVEALRGLCVLIPCSFEIKEEFDADFQKDRTGIWFKDGTDHNKNKVFNSKVTKENRIEGEIIGDLHMKNCTTIFYNIRESDSGRYYFRVETSGRLKHTYSSSSVDIRVQDSPISPSITLYKEDQGKVEDQNEVVEGTSVSLICSAPAPPCLLKPPTFTWNFLSEERRQEQNHNTSFSSSQLNFSATHLHHGVDFTCTATYQLQNKNKSAQSSFTLHVLCVLCREFSISLPESVEALRGLCVLIPCSFEIEEEFDADFQKDRTGIWFKDGTNHNNNKVFNSKETKENRIEGEIIGDLRMKNCTTIFYNIRERDSGRYYFRVETSGRLKHTYSSSSVDIRVRDSPISPSITLYKEDQGKVEDQNEVVEGTSVSLICSAPAPPCLLKPPTFTWNFLSEERRQEQNYSTNFSSSQLNFSATHLHHGVNFTCTATYQLQNKNKSAQSSLTLHVLCKC
ncbi:hypothetical protein PHYPO_G00084820 [Pangasianodon hypophthalmus]|uniref:Ig-like domain-containing protein n=1 Tax=Pangasianodon hypophthalmus TaxID=310915 RepID=A0A5N5LGI7_PANHP|nr:hypothetical protein PHYPO_G00084820 [Pangasianodon hypophthalmus]